MSEILVGSISEASHDIGLSEFFVGVFMVAIVGNAAEHWVAVLVAAKNKMDLAVNIAIGSSAQIALFVAPLLVLLSFVVGPGADGARVQRLRAGRPGVRRVIANLVTAGGRVELVRGRAAARAVRRAGPRLLLRLTRELRERALRGAREPRHERDVHVRRAGRRPGGSRGRAGARRARAPVAPVKTPPTGTPAAANGTWSDAPPVLPAGSTRARSRRAMPRAPARARGRVSSAP